MFGGTPAGPLGSTVVSKTKGGTKGSSNRNSSLGVATATVSLRMPVKKLNLETVYRALVVSSSLERRSWPFDSAFHPPPHARGILNSGNGCFINAVLQTLAFTPPFAQLAVSVIDEGELCPTLAAFGKWLLSYWTGPSSRPMSSLRLPQKVLRETLSSRVSTHLVNMNGSAQEDASEFMHLILDTVNAELCCLEKRFEQSFSVENVSHSSISNEGSNTKGWTFVNGKDRLSVRKQQDEQHSILFDTIFCGTLENHVRGNSKKRDHVSVVVEPFITLPIDVTISADCNLEAALERTMQTERIYDGVRGKELLMKVVLKRLPATLVLQVRRWVVTSKGEVVKLDNKVRLPKTLIIPKSSSEDTKLNRATRSYKLVAFIAHRGTAVDRGHYVVYLANVLSTTESAATGRNALTFCNDATVSISSMEEALERDAVYIVVYQRGC